MIAVQLKANDVKVFYDRSEKHNTWGKNLFDYLTEIYSRKARYCIIFISHHVGIIAMGGGEFRFDNVLVYDNRYI